MNKDHPEFVKRIIDEKKDLDDRLVKLNKFLGSIKIGIVSVSDTQQDLLKDQMFHMSNYSETLDRRIKDLTK